MPTQGINHDAILPQHREIACKRYKQYINLYLDDAAHVLSITNAQIQAFQVTQTTFIARFRDALNAIERYNWFGYNTRQLLLLSQAIVVSTHDGALVGTRTAIKAHRSTNRDYIANTSTVNNEVEILDKHSIQSVCYLIQHSALHPQPLFYTNIALSSNEKMTLTETFPNVVITPDDKNPNKHHFV